MDVLIGDIGNTITKICLIVNKTFKIKKIIYFDSTKIFSHRYLKKYLKKIIKNKSINNIALFSSVVPKYQILLKKFFLDVLRYSPESSDLSEKAIA